MNSLCDVQPILNSVEKYFSSFGFIFDKFFQNKDLKIDAEIVLHKIKGKTIDIEKLKSFLSDLPSEQWTIDVITSRVDEINSLFGITDEEILKHCVRDISEKELETVRWNILVLSMLESSKFANEYYDALKYNQNTKISFQKMKLLTELMMVFKYIKENSKKIYEKFEHANYNKKNLDKFNLIRFSIELLWMRILFIFFNLKEASDKKIEKFTEVLAKERISIAYQKRLYPRYN